MGKTYLTKVSMVCAVWAACGLSASTASADFLDDFDGASGSAPSAADWIVSGWANNGGPTSVTLNGAGKVVVAAGEPAVTVAGLKLADAHAVDTDPGGQYHRAKFETYSTPGGAGHKKFGLRVSAGAEAGGGKGVIHLSSIAGAAGMTLEVGNWEMPSGGEEMGRWFTGIGEEDAGTWIIDVYAGKALAYFNGTLVADTTTTADAVVGPLSTSPAWADIVPRASQITAYCETINGGTAEFEAIGLGTIPEPSTLALLGIGVLLAVRRKSA